MSRPPPVRVPPKQKMSVWGTPWPLDPSLLRVRLKYIGARFLQMPEPRMSLRNTEEILRFAEQMLDDGGARAATELTRLAIEEDPEQRLLWLFLFARAFETDDAQAFAELQPIFTARFPADAALGEIEVLSQWLAAPGHPPPDPGRTAPWHPRALLGHDGRDQRLFHDRLGQIAQSPPVR